MRNREYHKPAVLSTRLLRPVLKNLHLLRPVLKNPGHMAGVGASFRPHTACAEQPRALPHAGQAVPWAQRAVCAAGAQAETRRLPKEEMRA